MFRRTALYFALLAVTASAQQTAQTFKVKPLRPVEELRAEALRAQPPIEKGDFLKPDLVELIQVDSTLRLDIHYASTNNFLGTPVYSEARAFMERPAAEAVARANRKLHEQGFGILIFDAYRPWYVTKMFWDATPADLHPYVADPAEGSRHNRGCAVDLTIYALKTGELVAMPSTYDEFAESSHPDYTGGTPEQRANRDFLRGTMEAEGFTVYPTEWWHFDYKDWKKYPLLNVPFSDIQPGTRGSTSR